MALPPESKGDGPPGFHFRTIGIIHSCFKEKFGIPRQPGLVPAAGASLELLPPYDREEAFRGLKRFSHVWILFVFHQCLGRDWRPTVRPPRLGGNRRLGLFATRSGFRPNPIGLSVVELEAIERRQGRLQLLLRGVDLLDGTPVVDIKPYLPYVDRLESADGAFAALAPERHQRVYFEPAAVAFLEAMEVTAAAELRQLIRQALEQDPRPAYLVENGGRDSFGMRLWDFNLRWRVSGDETRVISIEKDRR